MHACMLHPPRLQTLAIDVGLNSAKFSMTRVINIFKRADQVDDTFKVSAADKRVLTGETAKGGDNGLELHEFFECLVTLALQTRNPKFGEVGHNDASAVPNPLPGCLDTLLNKSILKKAKTDTLAKVKKMVEKEPEVQVVLRPRKAVLKAHFEAAANRAAAKAELDACSLSERFNLKRRRGNFEHLDNQTLELNTFDFRNFGLHN